MVKSALNTDLLRSRLKLKNLQAETLLRAHHSQAVNHMEASGVKPGKIRSHATKLITATAAAGTLLVAAPDILPLQAALPPSSLGSTPTPNLTPADLAQKTYQFLKNLLPPNYGHLNPEVETQVSRFLHDTYGIHASAQLEGNRLNHSFGLLGAEQHLPRYPGDSPTYHDLPSAGITPGRGAWGYFAHSKNALTPDLIAKERYYFAVQTLYLEDWSTRLSYLRDWYKYRKVMAINPKNGKVIVGVVADSGPAYWTGKHFGGSPEVMSYLDMKDGKQRSSILLYFIDDPQDQVPLGPLEYNLEKPPLTMSI